jgi:hypothetical protein
MREASMHVVGVLGVIVGVFGGILGFLGWRTANHQAQVAKQSNKIARGAADEARKANGIAEAANELSAKANNLVESTVRTATETHLVTWEPAWDERACQLSLEHRGADIAFAVRVTVSGENVHRSETFRDIKAGGRVTLDLHEIDVARNAHEAERARRVRDLAARGITYGASGFSSVIHMTVEWSTTLGTPKFQSFDVKVT